MTSLSPSRPPRAHDRAEVIVRLACWSLVLIASMLGAGCVSIYTHASNAEYTRPVNEFEHAPDPEDAHLALRGALVGTETEDGARTDRYRFEGALKGAGRVLEIGVTAREEAGSIAVSEGTPGEMTGRTAYLLLSLGMRGWMEKFRYYSPDEPLPLEVLVEFEEIFGVLPSPGDGEVLLINLNLRSDWDCTATSDYADVFAQRWEYREGEGWFVTGMRRDVVEQEELAIEWRTRSKGRAAARGLIYVPSVLGDAVTLPLQSLVGALIGPALLLFGHEPIYCVNPY